MTILVPRGSVLRRSERLPLLPAGGGRPGKEPGTKNQSDTLIHFPIKTIFNQIYFFAIGPLRHLASLAWEIRPGLWHHSRGAEARIWRRRIRRKSPIQALTARNVAAEIMHLKRRPIYVCGAFSSTSCLFAQTGPPSSSVNPLVKPCCFCPLYIL